ncbi:hypothetical protein DFJ77DRAFT_453306 [Powellomyces hirtus]|nr:hypothetical protein DFJ77DRAFT_453306 [Powellomyces hirtus]
MVEAPAKCQECYTCPTCTLHAATRIDTGALNEGQSRGAEIGAEHARESGTQLTVPDCSGDFETKDELLAFAHEFAKRHGFGLSIRNGHKTRFYLRCKRGGDPPTRSEGPEDATPKRNRTSLKCGCKYRLYASFGRGGTNGWHLQTSEEEHNHDFSPPVAFHTYRQFNDEQQAYLRANMGLKPRDLAALFRQVFPDHPFIDTDLRNFLDKERRRMNLAVATDSVADAMAASLVSGDV